MSITEAVLDAGSMASNIAAVEVWTLNVEKTKLECPDGGWWLNPKFANDHPSEALYQLLLTPSTEPTTPGKGLAGLLYKECKPPKDTTYARLPTLKQVEHLLRDGSIDPATNSASLDRRCLDVEILLQDIQKCYDSKKTTSNKNERLKWMSMHDIVQYLDQGAEKRTILMSQCDIQYVAAVPFNFRGHKGMVLYYSHEKRKKKEDIYLLRAADLIGITSAVLDPYREVREFKMKQSESHLKRFRALARLSSRGKTLREARLCPELV